MNRLPISFEKEVLNPQKIFYSNTTNSSTGKIYIVTYQTYNQYVDDEVVYMAALNWILRHDPGNFRMYSRNHGNLDIFDKCHYNAKRAYAASGKNMNEVIDALIRQLWIDKHEDVCECPRCPTCGKQLKGEKA